MFDWASCRRFSRRLAKTNNYYLCFKRGSKIYNSNKKIARWSKYSSLNKLKNCIFKVFMRFFSKIQSRRKFCYLFITNAFCNYYRLPITQLIVDLSVEKIVEVDDVAASKLLNVQLVVQIFLLHWYYFEIIWRIYFLLVEIFSYLFVTVI